MKARFSPIKRTANQNKNVYLQSERTKRIRRECSLTVLPHCVTRSNRTYLLNVGRL